MNYQNKLKFMENVFTYYCLEILSTLELISGGYNIRDFKNRDSDIPKSIRDIKKGLCVSEAQSNYVALSYFDEGMRIKFYFSVQLAKKKDGLDWGHPIVNHRHAGFDTMTKEQWARFKKSYQRFTSIESRWCLKHEVL